MNKLPLISIIVPAFNAEKWIEECCNSVISQSYPNLELIIVDDGSTDGTLSLVRKLFGNDKRVQIVHTENGGVCHARNTGISISNGEYIAFLDSDDLMEEDAIKNLYSALVKTRADIAIGWKANMKSDGEVIGCPFERISGVFEGIEGLRLSLEDHPSMHAVWGKLYKRDLIGDTRFVQGKKVHEDSFFVFECMVKKPRVVICDYIVVKYRFSENSASRSGFSHKFLDILYFGERKRAIINERYPELFALGENVIIKANMALLWNLLGTNDPKYKEIQKKSIQSVIERKQYYRTAINSDAKMFWILTHHLYSVYKWIHMLRRKIRSLIS